MQQLLNAPLSFSPQRIEIFSNPLVNRDSNNAYFKIEMTVLIILFGSFMTFMNLYRENCLKLKRKCYYLKLLEIHQIPTERLLLIY